MLEFGTAGLRGALGAGPNRMNRSVVIRAAAGLTAYLKHEGGVGERPCVVIGFDARYNSDVFARDTAAVVIAAGGRALLLPQPLPTPVLAFAIRHLGADAGVMVTASHNPPQDNGYKVYLGDGSQIVPPADADIARHIAAVERVTDVPRAHEGWETLGERLLADYLDAVVTVVDPDSPRDLSIVHTSLHGVGHGTVHEAFLRAGFAAPIAVDEQAVPDPDFPTVAFPNPEEKGAIDLALARAREVRCDLVIANDPDADRCAAAILDPATGDWRMLRGDEVGALLGAHLVARGVDAPRRLRQLHRLVAAARLDRARRRHPPRGDADRLQVDLARRRAALRLRGGARLLRRPRPRARQGRRQRRPAARRARGRAQGAGAHPQRPARRPRHRARRARHRLVLRARRRPRADRPAHGSAARRGAELGRRHRRVEARRPEPRGRWPAAHRRSALPARRRLTGHRAPERHRAQGQGLSRGHRAGGDPRRPRPIAGGRGDPARGGAGRVRATDALSSPGRRGGSATSDAPLRGRRRR